jgi:quercetin dioxygenase-like cupin family protein
MPPPPILTRWKHHELPTVKKLAGLLRTEGLRPESWQSSPGDTFASHEHEYHKVLYCVEGSITFVMGHTDEHLELHAGDRLDLPAGWPHSALVGPEGVQCLEGHRPSNSGMPLPTYDVPGELG